MSRTFAVIALLCFTTGMVADANVVMADTTSETLKKGESVGVFYVTKVAGAEEDGVEPGEELCYRCRYGSSPMVLVFTRKTDGKIPELVKAIEAAAVAHRESRLRGLITFLGEDLAKVRDNANQIAKQTDVKTIPVAVAREHKTGPTNYKLPADADVTIVIASDSQVIETYTHAADRIDVGTVMKVVKQMIQQDR